MKKIWIKQYLICSCKSYVVTASLCVLDVWVNLGYFSECFKDIHKSGFEMYKHWCLAAEIPTICYILQVNIQVFISHYVLAQFICEGDNLGQCVRYCFWTSASWTVIVTLRVQCHRDWSSSTETDVWQMCKVTLIVLRAIFMRLCALIGSELVIKKLDEAHCTV